MFKKILNCSFVPKNNKEIIHNTFLIAQKFDSDIVFLKCIHQSLPTLALFHTKSEKAKKEKLVEEIHQNFEEIKDYAKNIKINVKTENVFVDSLSEFLSEYVKKNEIDLFIPDSIPSSDVDIQGHKDIINRIYSHNECAILTLR